MRVCGLQELSDNSYILIDLFNQRQQERKAQSEKIDATPEKQKIKYKPLLVSAAFLLVIPTERRIWYGIQDSRAR